MAILTTNSISTLKIYLSIEEKNKVCLLLETCLNKAKNEMTKQLPEQPTIKLLKQVKQETINEILGSNGIENRNLFFKNLINALLKESNLTLQFEDSDTYVEKISADIFLDGNQQRLYSLQRLCARKCNSAYIVPLEDILSTLNFRPTRAVTSALNVLPDQINTPWIIEQPESEIERPQSTTNVFTCKSLQELAKVTEAERPAKKRRTDTEEVTTISEELKLPAGLSIPYAKKLSASTQLPSKQINHCRIISKPLITNVGSAFKLFKRKEPVTSDASTPRISPKS